jgi:hypothetical protein
MDPGRLLATVQRVNASLAFAWTSAVLQASSQYAPIWQLAPGLFVAATAVFTFVAWVSADMSATAQRLALTVVAQQLFSLVPDATASLSTCISAVAYASMVLLALGSLRLLEREVSKDTYFLVPRVFFFCFFACFFFLVVLKLVLLSITAADRDFCRQREVHVCVDRARAVCPIA